MFDVIKVNHLERDGVKKIYIFSGDRKVKADWILEDGSPIFSETELKSIKDKNITIEVVDDYIHGDDTIITIKNKIINSTSLRISSKELYLFGIKTNKINPSILYNQLTQLDTYPLTGQRICQFLLNVVFETGSAPIECSSDIQYNFEDVLSLDIFESGEPIMYTFPIGQKLVLKKKYPFIANPFNCITMDKVIRDNASSMTSTQNSNLLFEYGTITDNNIFICLAEDVLKFAESLPDISEQQFMNLYFPNLAKDDITNIKTLTDKKIGLYDEQRKQFNTKFETYNKRINLLYNIFYNKKNNLNYINNSPGILKTEFIIHPYYLMKMPLDMLFKLIHSTKEVPLVKYNPGREKENIYRLFTDNITTNGKKIPYLYTKNGNRKGKLIALTKIIAKKTKVSYYIEYVYKGINFEIECGFEINGNITVTVKNSILIQRDILEEGLKHALNETILYKVQQFLEQSGYTFQVFDTFDQDNIEFKNITYISTLKNKTKFNISKYISCLSGVFTISDDKPLDKTGELLLKYKRVSNYNEFDSIDSFITDLRKNDIEHDIIIKKLAQNFDLSEMEAQSKFATWASQVNVETDLFENKAIAIRTNTGFPVMIKRNITNFEIEIKVTNINEIGYLSFIYLYVDSMLRLVFDKKSTTVSTDSIDSLCKSRVLTEISPEKDITSHKIKFQQDSDKADTFLNIIQGKTNDDEVDFTGVEFGDAISDEDETKGTDTESLGEDIDFTGIEFEEPVSETKGSKKEVDDEGDEDIDFGDIEFGDLDESIPSTAKDVRHLSETRSLPDEEKSETKKSKLSPQSDHSNDIEVDLKGLPLKGTNNIFIKRKMELEPSLFLKKEEGRYKAYSKSCPVQYSKHPIILTQEEKEYIDEKDDAFGTKSYDEHITYGTTPTKYHYICPRFWCLSDENGKQRSLSLKDINSGACGGWDALIPYNATKVPEGGRIVEFTDKRFHKENVDTDNLMVYKPMFPSFMSENTHPDGLCVPCCFGRPTMFNKLNSNWETKEGKKGTTEYYNTETKETTKKYPLIEYDDMYKPTGDSKHGPGPTYDTDKDGNIIMDSIRGSKQIRDAPANVRKLRYNDCNQAVSKKKLSAKHKSTKIDDAPLLETWPLKPGQIGYIPLAVQKFLGYNCRELCQLTLSDNNMKENTPCLLHKGVEKSDKQSFLSCVADFYYDATNPDEESKLGPLSNVPSLTIKQLKNIILKQMTLDDFVTLQNGELVSIFADTETVQYINIEDYNTTHLYQSLKKNKKSELYLQKVISAFITFGNFIRSDDVTIDYKYLWDYICKPQGKNGGGMFKRGMNLIILRSPDDDATSKIELICPVNHYSTEVYDINKNTVILYTKNGLFEPIYRYTKIKKHLYDVKKLFDIDNIIREMPEIAGVIKHIWADLITKCRPLPSMPAGYNQKYDFVTNIDLMSTLKILNTSALTYTFKMQIANFNSKVIGVLLEKKGSSDIIFLPCLPSAIDSDLPLSFGNQTNTMVTYKKTLNTLKYLKRASNQRLLCMPKYKVVNDSVIIGIITETNQIVATIPQPYQEPIGGEEADGLKTIIKKISPETFNVLDLDNTLIVNTSKDEERIKKVRNIRLESHFYNVFRNMLRIILSYYENKSTKDKIFNMITSPIIPYYQKLIELQKVIADVMQNHIIFSEFDDSVLSKINKIELCLNINNESCLDKEYCSMGPGGDDGICQMILPRKNLISGGDNSEQYFARLANELISFERIRTYIFVPKTFLSFQNISYNLHKNEIILLEDILYGDYFENIVMREKNEYVKDAITWSNAEPLNTVNYTNNFNISKMLTDKEINPCVITDPNMQRLTLGIWREKGLQEYTILEFKQNNVCSWEMFKDILNVEYPDKNHTISSIIKTLVDKYVQLSTTPIFDSILSILKLQGKKNHTISIQQGVSIKDVITSSNYYLSSFDFYLLSQIYNVPLILLCRTNIPSIFSKYISFINKEPVHCYIIFSGGYSNMDGTKGPNYGFISRSGSIQLSTVELGDVFTKITGLNITSTHSFIQRVDMAKKLNKRKKPRIVIKGAVESKTK